MKFNLGKIFLLGFGFFGVSVIWSTYNAYVPVFLSQRFGVPAGLIGFFMTLDNIAALFIQPTVGVLSDSLRTPIGRRMPFILIGAPISAVVFGLIPLAAVLPIFAACTISLILTMALWRTPVVALMPDITPSQYRSQANGVINLMGGLGAIIAFLGGASLYEMNPAYPFWLGGGLVVLSAVLVFLFVKEPKEWVATEKAKRTNPFKDLGNEIRESGKSVLFILLAIFFWFVSYNAIEAFFTLYTINYLGQSEADGARLLGQLSLIFVLFSLPSGYIGARIGRKITIIAGIVLMTIAMLAMFILPASQLTITITRLPVLGVVPVVGLILMLAGLAWSLININSLPMVVDMTENARIGTYTGLYYLFSTLAAIAGPNVNGWIVQLSGNNFRMVMLIGPIFMVLALAMMIGVRRGEARQAETPDEAIQPGAA